MSFRFLLVSVSIINVGLWDSISPLRIDPLANLAWGSPPMLHWRSVRLLANFVNWLIQWCLTAGFKSTDLCFRARKEGFEVVGWVAGWCVDGKHVSPPPANVSSFEWWVFRENRAGSHKFYLWSLQVLLEVHPLDPILSHALNPSSLVVPFWILIIS